MAHLDLEVLTTLILFFGVFFGGISVLHVFSRKIAFPYTVALLIAGFVTKWLLAVMPLGVDVGLSTNLIFYVLLPLILFESAMRINLHQFKIQFKTITFLATFGLMMSIFVIGAMIAQFVGLPFGVSLLFGAIISATDPIAVLSLFKTIKTPKRLGLIIEGESMLNDATAVIAFRVISGFVVASEVLRSQTLFSGVVEFVYVFIGSVIAGLVMGYIAAKLIEYIQSDRLVETTLTLSIALFSFTYAEHVLHLSGIIATVITAITVGNLGRTKISADVHHFIDDFWEYVGFIAISLIFFFAAFNLNLRLLILDLPTLLIVIFIVLIARAVSVYISFFLTNKLPFFKDEPNVIFQWQHVINWGGLRGIIPLVLVFSLPDDFAFKEHITVLALGTFIFTLLVNALTIEWLLGILGLRKSKKEERILEEELSIRQVERARARLRGLPAGEINENIRDFAERKLVAEEERHKNTLLKIAGPDDLLVSLRMQALEIELNTVYNLYKEGYITEDVYVTFEKQVDLQKDALNYPDVYEGRSFSRGGLQEKHKQFLDGLETYKKYARRYRFLKRFFSDLYKRRVSARYALLRARVVASDDVIAYMKRVKAIVDQEKLQDVVETVIAEHYAYKRRNKKHIRELDENFVGITKKYQKDIIHKVVFGE